MSPSYVIDRQRHADRLRRELELLETLQGPELPRIWRHPRTGATHVRVGRGPSAHFVGID